jgi:hypothetical protein
MYNKEKYVLKKLIEKAKLQEIIDSLSFWMIAGGACTSVFSDNQVNDLDIYFKSAEDYQKVVNKVMPSLKDNEYFATSCAFSFKRNGVRIQLIKKIFASTPEGVMDNFDFTVCECVYLPKTQEFVMGENFLADLCGRRLVYNINAKYPIASLWRVNKYVKKGFKLAAIESIKLALCINNLNIKNYQDLKEQLEGIDTLFLAELTDVLIKNENKEYDLKTALDYMNQVLEQKLNLMEEETNEDI